MTSCTESRVRQPLEPLPQQPNPGVNRARKALVLRNNLWETVSQKIWQAW